MDKPGYFCILTSSVRYDKRINSFQKILFSEILTLTNKTGECWATNSYFAELYDVTETYISLSIKKLIFHGYLVVRYENNNTKRFIEITDFDKQKGLTIVKEVLKNNIEDPLTIVKEGFNNSYREGFNNSYREGLKIVKTNNININKTRINNNNEYKHSKISNVSEKTFSEKNDITETVIEEIALQNNLPIHFVEAQWKLAKLYLDSNGIKKTNHKAYLETWVLKEKLRIEEKQNKESVIADFRNIN